MALLSSANRRYRKHSTLTNLNLPSSLDALEKSIGLPPSLLRKAEEVRVEQGSHKIQMAIEDIEKLSTNDTAILDEALDILDGEASEDESARRDGALPRPSSQDANPELISKAQRYRAVLEEALASDEHVRSKWDQWSDNVEVLALEPVRALCLFTQTGVHSPLSRRSSNFVCLLLLARRQVAQRPRLRHVPFERLSNLLTTSPTNGRLWSGERNNAPPPIPFEIEWSA